MANPIRLPGTAPKTFSSSKVAQVSRQKLENRQKKHKRDPHGQPRPDRKKEPEADKRDLQASPSGRLSPKEGPDNPSRKKGADPPAGRQGNLINIRI